LRRSPRSCSQLCSPLVATIVSLHRPAIIAVLSRQLGAVVLPIVENHLEGDCLVLLLWVSAIDIVTVLAIPLVLASGGVALLGSLLVIAARRDRRGRERAAPMRRNDCAMLRRSTGSPSTSSRSSPCSPSHGSRNGSTPPCSSPGSQRA
jgi:hypothetical protein